MQSKDDPELLAGYLEKSNVTAMRELNTMTANMRLFEAEAAAIRDIARTVEKAISVVGRA